MYSGYASCSRIGGGTGRNGGGEDLAQHPEAAPNSSNTAAVSLLRHLEALTFTFHRNGQQFSPVLVYAVPDSTMDNVFHPVAAADMGFEGIACVDDTARAALLALDVYERSRSRKALALARGWLTFVQYMQYPDGSFANFIRNAAGVRNASGPTSFRGGHAWSMRALWALARGYRVTRDRAYLKSFDACHLAPTPDNKVNAVLALAELELYRAHPTAERKNTILARCAHILQPEGAPFFRDRPDREVVQLWGYHQLHAVTDAAAVFEQPEMLRRCRTTVRHLVEPDVRDCFWHSYPDRCKDGVCAYDVAPMVQGLAAMYWATRAERYRTLALKAAAWFYGRNDARVVMYEPSVGRCRDGISGGVASENCGAESAIEAGFAELVRRDLVAPS